MRPNFTGEWKLVLAESEFGFLPPPRLRVDSVAHNDPALRMETRQKDANGDITVVRELTIGAAPVPLIIRGNPRRIRAFWDQRALVVETTSEVSGKERRITDRWTMEAGAERLLIERRHQQPGGPVHQRLVLTRKGADQRCASQ